MTFPSQTKFLIVDDSSTELVFLRQILAEAGYKDITEAKDGTEAWSHIETAGKAGHPFQVIICDLTMPGIEGLELLERVRKAPNLKKAAFIMLTGHGELQKVLKAAQAGVSSYVVKPFEKQVLLDKLANIYRKRERQDKAA